MKNNPIPVLVFLTIFILPFKIVAEDKIKVGVIIPLTSASADYGFAIQNSIKYAIEDSPELFNRLEFSYEDNSGDSRLTVDAFQKQLHVNKADIIVTWGIAPCKILSPLARANKLPFIGICIDPEATKINDQAIRFMNVTDNFMQRTVEYLKSQKFKKIALIASDHSYNEEMYEALKRSLPADIKIDLINRLPVTEFDFRKDIIKIKKGDYDAFGVFLYFGQVATFYKQVKQMDLTLPSFGNNLMESLSEVKASNGSMDGAIFANIKINPEFEKRYQGKYGNNSQLSFGAPAYEMAKTLGSLFTTNPKLHPKEIIDYISQMGVQVGVASGPYHFEEQGSFGKQISFPVGMKQIVNSNFITIE